MRSTVLLILVLVSSGKLLASDSELDLDPIRLDIKSLNAPSIPAFGILDLNPSSISRPLSPKEFRLSVLSSVAESSSAVPGNIAIEFSPYWWKSRPNLTFKKLFIEPSVSLSIKQSLSYSIATVTQNAQTDTESTDVSFGVRFTPFPGKLSKASLKSYQTVLEAGPAIVRKLSSPACKDATKTQNQEVIDQECTPDPKYSEAVTDFRDSSSERRGFRLDVSAAIAYNIPSNDTSSRDFSRGGVWLTSAYSKTGNDTAGGFQYLGLVRYLQERNAETRETDDSLDAGVRIIWRHDDEPIAFSFEYINRFRDEGSNAERYAGIFEYKINETLNLTASLGKNFREEGANDDLFVLGGISFNIGEGQKVQFDQ